VRAASVAAGADPDLEDPERITPLNMALLNLHYEFAAFMINAGPTSISGSLRPLADLHGG
jgi:ankyrin repeat protein